MLMDKIDCFGEICPIPLVKLQKKLKELNPGESVMLVVDHSCSVEALRDFYESSNHILEFDEVINGVWEITVTKML